MVSHPTRRASCPSRSSSLVCQRPIALLGLSKTNTIGAFSGFVDGCSCSLRSGLCCSKTRRFPRHERENKTALPGFSPVLTSDKLREIARRPLPARRVCWTPPGGRGMLATPWSVLRSSPAQSRRVLPTAAHTAPGETTMLPAPGFHHLHLNSVDPDAAIDFYIRQFFTSSKTTWGGLPALKAMTNVLILFNRVASAPATAPQ